MKIEKDNIYNLDCILGMSKMGDSSVDLIITDPPFAINFSEDRGNYNRDSRNVINGYIEVKESDYEEFTNNWIMEAYRVLSESGSCFIFSGWNNLRVILNAIEDAGFVMINHIIWKFPFGVVCSKRFVSSHYHCLFLCKNKKNRKFFNSCRFKFNEKDSNGRSLRYRDMEDVWVIKKEYWRGVQKTPTKLPAEIIKKILKYASEEGDLVFDPFIGSGQVPFVSRELSRHYIGFEISENYYNFAKKRLDTGEYYIRQ